MNPHNVRGEFIREADIPPAQNITGSDLWRWTCSHCNGHSRYSIDLTHTRHNAKVHVVHSQSGCKTCHITIDNLPVDPVHKWKESASREGRALFGKRWRWACKCGARGYHLLRRGRAERAITQHLKRSPTCTRDDCEAIKELL